MPADGLIPGSAPVARRLAATLQPAGWHPRDLDIDLVAGRLRIELHRTDGRWILLSADPLGRAHVERWHRTIALGKRPTDRGRVPTSLQIHDEFLGRQSCSELREALRWLCDYVTDNPAPGCAQLCASSLRTLLLPLDGTRAT